MAEQLKIFVEKVSERIGGHVLISTCVEATPEDIDRFKKLHEAGNYDHNGSENLVCDTRSWLYDFRSCAVCGKGLGTV